MKDMFGEFIYRRTYARWIEEEQRRENWTETVDRYRNYFLDRFVLPDEMTNKFNSACDMIQNKDIMPSMRAMWTAGKALDTDSICSYNCSYIIIDSVKSFADMMYLLMSGCGVGYSVERQVITKLPVISSPMHNAMAYDTEEWWGVLPRTVGDVISARKQSNETTESLSAPPYVVFADSKIGWAEGLLEYMTLLYGGIVPTYDLSLIRPKGARLKTFGGKAGGSDDLKMLLDYIAAVFTKAAGRRLTSLECHDICCYIANVVVSAGIRRSACISLSNLSDTRMRDCKVGEFWKTNPQRQMANNSVAYTEKPDMHIWMQEWMSLMNSGAGERGIFNRCSAIDQFIANGRDTVDGNGDEYLIGVNPCGEVVLRPNQACNLSEVIVRPDDTIATLLSKAEHATVLGCIQSCMTDIKFLDPTWKKNMEDERLLGVSLTGVRDHPVLSKATQHASLWLTALRERVHDTAKDCAAALGINVPSASTCNKPSGTVSSLTGVASGIHTRFSPYYIRRVRVASTDVICVFLKAQGVPCHPEVGQDTATASTWVFDFPIKSPPDSVFDTSAIEQLDYWKMFKVCWTDHNPSVTISVMEDEWLEVGAWVYKNWDIVGGLSFLPKSDNIYQLAPFEAITKEMYECLVEEMPDIDFADLVAFERDDETTGAQILACTAGGCEAI